MPLYFRRPHDDLLDALLNPDRDASRLVVIRGSSSTGKTRAAFEAVANRRLKQWRLHYPRTKTELATLLEAGIGEGTVLWLGQLPDYTSGEDKGAAVMGRLVRLLEEKKRVIVITTMWPEHWTGYLQAARTTTDLSQDPVGSAWKLLLAPLPELAGHDPALVNADRGGVIEIPSAFTTAEVIEASRNNVQLADAARDAASCGDDGKIAQYLAGAPDLLDHWQGSGNLHGQAIITAAMDAARLGYGSPLPKALLLDAAPGYLDDPRERVLDKSAWAGKPWEWATEELRGAFQAVQPVPHPRGTGPAGYRPADYLDQHGRETREDQAGPVDLWDALVDHTTETADLMRLAASARGYGLYRYAAALWTRAADRGSARAAHMLIGFLHWFNPECVSRAASWAVEHARADDAFEAYFFLDMLRTARAGTATIAFAERAAEQASLDHNLTLLLIAMHQAGADNAVRTLAARAAEHASADDPLDVIDMLSTLYWAGAQRAVTTLAARAAEQASVDNGAYVEDLLHRMDEVGTSDAATALAARAVKYGSPDDWWTAANRPEVQRRASDAASVPAAAPRVPHFDDYGGPGPLPDNPNAPEYGFEPNSRPSAPWSWEEPGLRNAS